MLALLSLSNVLSHSFEDVIHVNPSAPTNVRPDGTFRPFVTLARRSWRVVRSSARCAASASCDPVRVPSRYKARGGAAVAEGSCRSRSFSGVSLQSMWSFDNAGLEISLVH